MENFKYAGTMVEGYEHFENYSAIEKAVLDKIDSRKQIKNILCALTMGAISVLGAQEALASSNLAGTARQGVTIMDGSLVNSENNGFSEEIIDGEKTLEERAHLDRFIQEVEKIEPNLSEVEMEAKIMSAVFRLDLFLQSMQRERVKNKDYPLQQKALDLLSRYQDDLLENFSHNSRKTDIIKSLLSKKLSIE